MFKKFYSYFILLSALINAQQFITRIGNKLYLNGNEIKLKGISFGNLVWVDNYADSPNLHHTEKDFKRVKELGMNVIRFYLNYKTFENNNTPYQYKNSGWTWLNQNVQWA
jgi:endoglucanase